MQWITSRLRDTAVPLVMAVGMLFANQASALEPDELDPNSTLTMSPQTMHMTSETAGGGVLGNHYSGSVLGIDTLANFSSYFYFPGSVPGNFGDFPQYTWQYSMVGRSPVGTGGHDDGDDAVVTRIRAPIVPVILDLRNSDGSPRFFTRPDGVKVRMIMDPTKYLTQVLQSPIFAPTQFSSSGRRTQYTDALQRAEFANVAGPGWHTLLQPVVMPARTMVLIRGTYSFSTYADGTLRFVLVNADVFGSLLFPPTSTDTTTVMGAAEHAGDVKTTDLSTFFFGDTYLFQGTTANCCILGYHSYDQEPGDAGNGFRERHYVMNYSSWISPGIFRGAAFLDVTALSHELAETFNDPFVNNATPIWVGPNGLCQNNLEVGDVVEGLPNASFPMTMPNGFTYHPQNEALLQWFAGVTPSSALGGAYSYPDPSLLTSAAVSLASDCVTPSPFAKN
jgi:hypothetical protein